MKVPNSLHVIDHDDALLDEPSIYTSCCAQFLLQFGLISICRSDLDKMLDLHTRHMF